MFGMMFGFKSEMAPGRETERMSISGGNFRPRCPGNQLNPFILRIKNREEIMTSYGCKERDVEPVIANAQERKL